MMSTDQRSSNMSTDQRARNMSTENGNNEISEDIYEKEIQTLLGANANYIQHGTAEQTENETMEEENGRLIYVEGGVDDQTYLFDGESLKVSLISNNTYITDLIRTACQARINNLYTDLTFICKDGSVPAHSFLLDKLFFYCDIFFQMTEEDQLIFVPDCSKAQVESAVLEVYNCGTINRFCQLLNIHDGKDPAPVNYQNNQEDSSKYRISVRDIDELLDAKDKQLQTQVIKKVEENPEKVEDHEQTFKCIKCDHRTRTRSLLRAHMMKNHKSTKSQSLLKVNNRTKIREPTKISAVTVDKPNNILLEPDNKDESKNAATPMLENELVYSCLLCDFRTDSKFDLNQHKSQKHVKGERKKKHNCPHCDFSSTRVRLLKVHTVKEHKDIPKKFKCNKCDFATNYQINVDKHMKKFHLGIPGSFQCTQCPRTFFVLAKLKCHQLVHTEEKNFVCEECAAKFKRKDDLKSHMKIHLPDDIRLMEKAKKLTKACPNCGKLFEKNWKLQRHMKVHNKENIVIERAQVPMRWEPIGGVVLTDSASGIGGVKASSAIAPNADAGTAIVEIDDEGLPPVQEFIVLTTDDTGGSDGGGAAVAAAGHPAAHSIIEDDDKYWV